MKCRECQSDKDMEIQTVGGKDTYICLNCQYREWVD